MTMIPPKPGDVLLVSCHPGNPNGKRSRAGLLFTVAAQTLLVVAANGADASPDSISIAKAKELIADDGLIVVEGDPK